MPALIAAYSLLPGDCTTEARLTIVTDSDAGTLTLDYGADAGDLSLSVSVSGAQIPSRSEYIYHAKLSGLPSDSLIHHAVSGLYSVGTVKPLRTFPASSPTGGLRLIALNDPHAGAAATGMSQPDDMLPVGAELPDIALFPGDMVNQFSEDYGETNGGWWITFVDQYLSRLSQGDFLVPIVWIPGNHEVGNHQWDGTGAVNPAGTYYRVFAPNIAEDVAPVGVNYGSFMVGDYLQLLGLDSHSAQPLDVGDWLRTGIIDSEARHVIPFQHSPLVAADIRGPNDPALQERCRNGWFRLLHEAENVLVSFAGHIHARTRTVEMGIVETDPGGSEKFALEDTAGNPDGWLVEQAGGIVEFGQGYRNNRSGGDTAQWYFAHTGINQKNYNVITAAPDFLRVQTKNEFGGTVYSRRWPELEAGGGVRVQVGGEWIEGSLFVQSGGEWGPGAVRTQAAGEWA